MPNILLIFLALFLSISNSATATTQDTQTTGPAMVNIANLPDDAPTTSGHHRIAISGYVRFNDGRPATNVPVVSVRVHYGAMKVTAKTRTDHQGYYFLFVPHAYKAHGLLLSAYPGFTNSQNDIPYYSTGEKLEERLSRSLTLWPTVSLSGTVYSNTSACPVAGAEVAAWPHKLHKSVFQDLWSGYGTVLTDKKGSFTITGLPPWRTFLYITSPGKRMFRETIKLPHGPMIIYLRNDGTLLSGTVTDAETSRPVPGAKLKMALVKPHTEYPRFLEYITDSHGTYRTHPLEDGTYFYACNATGYELWEEVNSVQVLRDPPHQRLDISLTPQPLHN